MWFISRVADFHEAGRDGNRQAFHELVERETDPLGLIAYRGTEPVGWCAAGPRRRYARVLRAPTLKKRNRDEDGLVWLVPCFFIREDARHAGVATALLTAAVDLARKKGAAAVEGFPLAGTKPRSGGSDFMTGVEDIFSAVGFQANVRPSDNRVIMRLELS
jgi:GNAT superfamily N-acetyltransferase